MNERKKYMRAHRFAEGGAMPGGQPGGGGGQPDGGGQPMGGGGQPGGPGGMPPGGDPAGGGGDPMQQLDGIIQQYSQSRTPELAMQGMDLLIAIQGGGQGGGQESPGAGAPMSSEAGAPGAPGGGGGGQPSFGKGGNMGGKNGKPVRKFGKAPAAPGDGKFRPQTKK